MNLGRTWLCIWIGFFLFATTGTRAESTKPPVARDGILDLRGTRLGPEASLFLDGEWDFYWKRLLEPSRFNVSPPAPARNQIPEDALPVPEGDTIHVPGMWNGHESPEGPLPGAGFATLRLMILAPDARDLALKVPTMHTAYLLFANGQTVAGNGQVGRSLEESRPRYRPLVASLPPPNAAGRIELVLWISNYHHRKGGTWRGIELGHRAALLREHERGLLIAFLLLGALLIMGFYHLVLYAFRPGETSPLFLGLFCLLIVLRILSTGEHALDLLWPTLPWEAYVKIQYLSYYAAIPAWAFFVRAIFPDEFRRWHVHAVSWPVALVAVIVLSTPVRIYSHTMWVFEFFTLFLAGVLFLMLFRTLRNRRDGALLFLVGWVVFAASIVHDILLNREIIQSIELSPFGVFGFILVQSALLAGRFSHAFDVAEQLSENLEHEVRVRTSELSESRDELGRARDRAEQSSRAKSEFLAAMSHEIRTPLNSILGTSALLRESELPPDARHQVEILNRAGSKLINLINEVLDLSRIEAGKQVLEDVVYDPVAQARDLIGILEGRAREKGIQIDFRFAPDFPRAVTGDPIRVEQILLNLLGNALKFTERGTILLSLKPTRTTLGEARLEFLVKDTGIGILPEKLPTIFESFVQADQGTARRYEGSGLGLAICKRLVELMGGEISVSSRPGLGSEFRFAIPYSNAAGHTTPPRNAVVRETESLPAIRPGARVLLVEDNPDNRYLIEAYLARTGVQLAFAENGREAVEYVQNNPCDLVLMDIQMPIMDGYQATRVIRSWEEETERRPLVIIALTANATLEAVRKSEQAGCHEHLTKPLKKQRLLETIARYLNQQETPVSD